MANKEDAEDIVQELFINVWDKGKDDMPEEEFAAYMTTSVKNRSISFLRQKQENTVSLEDHPSVSAQIAEETHSPEREELPLEEHLRIALTTLPPKCKEIFLMAKLKGMKYREIAQDLNLSEKTIENQMTKAIKLLRLYLAANRQALMALLITIILSILRIK